MRTALIAYCSTALVFFALDFIWLSMTGTVVYKSHLQGLMLDKPHLPVAASFYLMYVIAVIIFAVLPAVTTQDWSRALWAGALLGFTAYGAYDLTNQATLVGWSSFVSVMDMAWGTVATACAATAGYFITRAFL